MAILDQLQSKLEELFGSENVYYQSPPSTSMKYPAILYSRRAIDRKLANNKKYSLNTCSDQTLGEVWNGNTGTTTE